MIETAVKVERKIFTWVGVICIDSSNSFIMVDINYTVIFLRLSSPSIALVPARTHVAPQPFYPAEH